MAQMWICRMEVARTGRCGTCPKWSSCLCYWACSQRVFHWTPIFSCLTVLRRDRFPKEGWWLKSWLVHLLLIVTFNRVIPGVSTVMRLPSFAQSPARSPRPVNVGCWNGYLQLCAGHLAVSACDTSELPKCLTASRQTLLTEILGASRETNNHDSATGQPPWGGRTECITGEVYEKNMILTNLLL